MNAENPTWVGRPKIPPVTYYIRHMSMFTFNGYLHSVGGYSSSYYRNYHYRITNTASDWESRAVYPRGIGRLPNVVDHVKGRVYFMGGYSSSSRSECYYYTPSSNSWTQIRKIHESNKFC